MNTTKALKGCCAIGFILLLFSGCAAPNTSNVSSGNASVSAEPKDSILGEWRGLYFSYPYLMVLEFSFRQGANGQIEGESAFRALDPQKGYTVTPPLKGRLKDSVTYDAVTRTFLVRPVSWVEQSGPMGNAVALQGVLDVRSQSLAGTFAQQFSQPVCPYFVMVRPEAAKKLFSDVQICINKSGGKNLSLSGVSENEVAAWVARMKTEYPGINPKDQEAEVFHRAVRNLFEDTYFKKSFGETYEATSASKRASIRSKLTLSFNPHPPLFGQPYNNSKLAQDYGGIAQTFYPGGSFSATDITLSVFAQRVLRSWEASQRSHIREMTPEREAFAQMAKMEQAATIQLATLWPSELRENKQAFADNRARLAEPYLTRSADAALASASGLEGARNLASWGNREAEIIQFASRETVATQQARLFARLDEILEPLMTPQAAAISGFGSGTEAVLNGGRWYRQFASSYDFARSRPPVQRVTAQVQARRGTDLAAVRDYYLDLIERQKSEKGVDYVTASVLVVPGDADSTAGRAISERARERKTQIENDRVVNAVVTIVGFIGAIEAIAGDKGLAGSGSSGSEDLCFYCNGKGKKTCYACAPTWGGSPPYYCLYCNDRGEVDCGMCGGTGKVRR